VTAPHLEIPPGPGFVATVAAATGILRTPMFKVAQLLITHPGPRHASENVETVEDGMRRLACALHLGPGDQSPPMIGPRIIVRRGVTALDYGHDDYVMSLPSPSQEWVRLLVRGGPCRVCLSYDPLPLAADQGETDAHLRASLERETLVWGTTYLRGHC